MDKLDRLGWVVHESYDINGFRIGVRTTSPAFGAWFQRVLAPHHRSGRTDPHFSVVGAEEGSPFGRRRHVLYRGAESIVRTDDTHTLGRALLAELESVLFAERDDAVYLDAGVVSMEGRIGLVPAGLLSYIAPATRRAERIGLQLPGARTVALDPQSGRLRPVEGVVSPNPTFDGLDAGGDGRFFVDSQLVVDAVFPVAWESNEMRDQVSAGVALYHMAGAVLNLPRLGQTALHGVGRMVESAHRFELSAARPAAMIDAIASILADLPKGSGHRAFSVARMENGES